MTYRNAYKALNQTGAIDRIINAESQAGANLNQIKVDLIFAIEYYTDFTKTSMFREMHYWQDNSHLKTDAEKSRQRIINAVCKALAEHELETIAKNADALRYMVRVQRTV